MVTRILLCGALFLVLFTLNNIMYRVAAITLIKKFLESDKLCDCLNSRPIIVLCRTMMKQQQTAALNRIHSREINIVLLSFGIGLVGHNFQMFLEVFFLDRNWNPQVCVCVCVCVYVCLYKVSQITTYYNSNRKKYKQLAIVCVLARPKKCMFSLFLFLIPWIVFSIASTIEKPLKHNASIATALMMLFIMLSLKLIIPSLYFFIHHRTETVE